jgi:hypothetical protein
VFSRADVPKELDRGVPLVLPKAPLAAGVVVVAEEASGGVLLAEAGEREDSSASGGTTRIVRTAGEYRWMGRW